MVRRWKVKRTNFTQKTAKENKSGELTNKVLRKEKGMDEVSTITAVQYVCFMTMDYVHTFWGLACFQAKHLIASRACWACRMGIRVLSSLLCIKLHCVE